MPLNPEKNNLIVHEIKKSLGKKDSEPVSRYQMAKGAWRLRKMLFRELRSATMMLLGVLSAGFGLQGFLIPNKLIDGGVMGISLLTNKETGISLSFLIIAINLQLRMRLRMYRNAMQLRKRLPEARLNT